MYTVNPAAARIEPGDYLKIQSKPEYCMVRHRLVFRVFMSVLRMPVEVEPPAPETCPDLFSFLGTLFHPEQEDLDLSDVVRTC